MRLFYHLFVDVRSYVIVVPINFLSSRASARLVRFFPFKILTVTPCSCASLLAMGSNGAFIPGFHVFPTILRYTGHVISTRGLASGNFLGSLL